MWQLLYALFVRLISHQPAVLFSQNKPAPAISHQTNEQASNDWIFGLLLTRWSIFGLLLTRWSLAELLNMLTCGILWECRFKQFFMVASIPSIFQVRVHFRDPIVVIFNQQFPLRDVKFVLQKCHHWIRFLRHYLVVMILLPLIL
jgi:hypothetical protein